MVRWIQRLWRLLPELGDVLNDALELVVGWLPASPGGSLSAGMRSLMPALMYADNVIVLCPHSDDAVELDDFFDLREAMPIAVEFLALDSAYASVDREGNRLTQENGSALYDPLAPRVWHALAVQYATLAQGAIVDGRRDDAKAALARFLSLQYATLDMERTVRASVPAADQSLLEESYSLLTSVRDEVVVEWLLGAYVDFAFSPRRYALIDDAAGTLTVDDRKEAVKRFNAWARGRSVEASLGTNFLQRRLPSPRREETWDVVADVRERPGGPLRRFRVVMAKISVTADLHPLEVDFEDYVEAVWRTEVTPALDELENLVRESSLRAVFFDDVMGDLSGYAGPLLGILMATTEAVPLAASAAIAAVSPLASTIKHYKERRRALRSHDFLFLHQAARRMR